jgi:hypothetical protein
MLPSDKAIYDTFLSEANGCKPGRPTDAARLAAFERFWRGEKPSFDACADRYKYLKTHKNKGTANAFASALGYSPSVLNPSQVRAFCICGMCNSSIMNRKPSHNT